MPGIDQSSLRFVIVGPEASACNCTAALMHQPILRVCCHRVLGWQTSASDAAGSDYSRATLEFSGMFHSTALNDDAGRNSLLYFALLCFDLN
jgi:hypothetical protein